MKNPFTLPVLGWFGGAINTLSLFVLFAGTLSADPARAALANLSEDVRLLSQRVGVLQLEVEELKRENTRLRNQVSELQRNDGSRQRMNEVLQTLETRMETLRREFRQADEAQKTAIIAEVSSKINALASETQRGLNALAEAINVTPQVPTTQRFSDDFPSTGVLYTVRPGDTLSGIARAHGARVRDIQNANRIPNPNALQAGQELVIPIRE
jgi:LysM repeat protein